MQIKESLELFTQIRQFNWPPGFDDRTYVKNKMNKQTKNEVEKGLKKKLRVQL